MVCSLMAPSHYQNQCWLIKEVLWHSPEVNFTGNSNILIIKIDMKIHIWNQSYLSDTNELINNFLLATDSIIWDWWVTPVTNQEDSGVGGCGGGGVGGWGGYSKKFWRGCGCVARIFTTIPLATETESQIHTLGYRKWVKINPLTTRNVTKLTTFEAVSKKLVKSCPNLVICLAWLRKLGSKRDPDLCYHITLPGHNELTTTSRISFTNICYVGLEFGYVITSHSFLGNILLIHASTWMD